MMMMMMMTTKTTNDDEDAVIYPQFLELPNFSKQFSFPL